MTVVYTNFGMRSCNKHVIEGELPNDSTRNIYRTKDRHHIWWY